MRRLPGQGRTPGLHLRQGQLPGLSLGFLRLTAYEPGNLLQICGILASRRTVAALALGRGGGMGSRGLVIFDAFNTLVTSRRDSRGTFLEGLERAGICGADPVLAGLQAASEGLDHSAWSGSRRAYVGWTTAVLRELSMVGLRVNSNLARCVVPALEQLHQAPMVARRDARSCLKQLKAAGFTIAVCSNWGWDLAADIAGTGLLEYVDYPVSSAQAGWRKPHPRIYRSVLSLARCAARDAVFVGDSLRTDVLGPQRAGIRSFLLSPAAATDFHGEAIDSLTTLPRLLSG